MPIIHRPYAGLRLSRRHFVAGGLATLGAAAAPALGQGRPPTAESPMGPFYPVVRPADSDYDLTQLPWRAERAAGTVIEVSGRVFDMRGNPVPGARIELWQANAAGRYDHPSDVSTAPLDPNFQGFAEIVADRTGDWRIVTIKPGGYDSPIGHRPPHIHFAITGNAHRNVAQLYFPEEAEGNARDALYRALGEGAASSLATRDAADPGKYRWDVVMMEG